jgi:formate dehydrogenase major subunit
MANVYAPLRAGSDIVLLGALIHDVLERLEPIVTKEPSLRSARERFFHDYLVHYTNAATLITEDFKDTEEDALAGLFAGFDQGKGRYDVTKWRYDTEPPKQPGSQPEPGESKSQSFSAQVAKLVGPRPKQDESLQNPRCVFRILKQHYQRYTPELVEQVCGTPRETFLKVADTLWNNAGPERTGAICYAVGWTQHTVGVQMIRAAAVLQLLLGNVGRPRGRHPGAARPCHHPGLD